MAAYEYDIAVIGAGPGGYVAAIAAAKEGKTVCIIERAAFGGVCLNEGCIPTKTLIKTINLLQEMKQAASFGIEGLDSAALSVSMPRLQERRRRVVSRLAGGVKSLLKGNKVTILEGEASFLDRHTLKVGNTCVTAENIIIAAGSLPFMPPFIPLKGKTNVITSKEALELVELPASMAIIGGGVVGIEFAYLLHALGCSITVLERMNRILPTVDAEISAMVQQGLQKAGIVFHLGAKVGAIHDNTVLFETDGATSLVTADMVLMAVGRLPDIKALHLEAVGVACENGAIVTDEYMRTNVPGIYATGDVNARMMLAHTASHEGMIAVKHICGKQAVMRYNAVPSCIYLEPEVASIGLTEEEARAKHAAVKVGKFPMGANGKSLVEGGTAGMIKVIADGDTGEILGAHLFCKHATDMIAEIALAMTLEATVDDIMETIHPHPTVSESVPEAFMAAFGKAVHVM
jgi:dihydrolipoamide dehydrogenase